MQFYYKIINRSWQGHIMIPVRSPMTFGKSSAFILSQLFTELFCVCVYLWVWPRAGQLIEHVIFSQHATEVPWVKVRSSALGQEPFPAVPCASLSKFCGCVWCVWGCRCLCADVHVWKPEDDLQHRSSPPTSFFKAGSLCLIYYCSTS